ncbi:MAG TPA: VTT domain-containing protein [Gemmatirosa sp.]
MGTDCDCGPRQYIPARPLSPRSHIPLWLLPDAVTLSPLEQLSAYLTLAVTPIITEEFAPILGGLAVSQGQLGLVRVIVAVTVGGWIATALLYLLGAWQGPWVRRRFPQAGRAMDALTRAVCKRPWRASFAVRIAFGARLLLPLACGVAHVRPAVYFVGSLAGSAAWSIVFVLIGYEFGEAAIHTLERVRAYDRYGYALVAIAVVIGAGVLWRRRARREAADTLPE